QGSIATKKLGTIAGRAACRIVDIEEGDPVRELTVVGITREYRAIAGGDLGCHVHRRLGAQVAQYPLDISGRSQPPRTARKVGYFQRGKLDGRIQRREDRQLRPDFVLRVFEN